MMYMKKYLFSLIATFALLISFLPNANAAGSVSASFGGSSSVTKGSNISLSINISSVSGSSDGKMYAFGGYVTYDSSVLQYVSFSGSSGWTGSTGTASSGRIKIATVDYSMSHGVSSGSVGTITFKALATGSTTVSMNTIEATDKSKNLDVSFSGKSVTVNEPAPVKSNDSKLKSLSLAGYSLSPSFSSGTKSYTVSVPSDTNSVSISATANHSKATVSGTGTVNLTSDSTTANIVVTAEDGSKSTYSVTINRAKKSEPTPKGDTEVKKSSNSLLKSLNVSGYTLHPSFASGTKAYTMSVGNGITGLNVTAIPYDSKAKVSISGNRNWKVGKNTIKITVTAEDGSKSVYKVTVTRAKKNSKVKSSDKNVDLRILSSHSISPSFTNDVNVYKVTVPSDVNNLELSAIPYDKNTKVQIAGTQNLKDDKTNVVTIKVTAEDGSTKTITLNVTKTKKKSNAKILDLIVKNNNTLSPKFDPQVEKYTVDVDDKTNKLDLEVKVPDGVTYEITGNENFVTGRNIVTVTVKDKNEFTKNYELTVTKAAPKAVKKDKFTFGWREFLILAGLLLLILLLLLLLLFRRKKDEEEPVAAVAPVPEKTPEPKKETSPVNIDFKPEFNFNSRNGTDDDQLYAANGDIINGGEKHAQLPPADVKVKEEIPEAEVYDPYDDNVTKDELFDAINESMETKQLDKLEMLLAQERLNRKKKALKRKEAGKRSEE